MSLQKAMQDSFDSSLAFPVIVVANTLAVITLFDLIHSPTILQVICFLIIIFTPLTLSLSNVIRRYNALKGSSGGSDSCQSISSKAN